MWSFSLIVRVSVVLRGTGVGSGDRRFDAINWDSVQCIAYSTKYFLRDDFFATFTRLLRHKRTEQKDLTLPKLIIQDHAT